MKKQLLTLLAGLISGTLCLNANSLGDSHKIKEVIVYPGHALVTREMSVDIQPGENKIIWENLPLALDQNSLRASGKSSIPVKILSLDSQEKFIEKNHQTEIEALQQQIRSVEDRKAIHQDEIKANNESLQTLNLLRTKLTAEIEDDSKKNRINTDQLRDLFDFYSTQYETLLKKHRQSEMQIRDLDQSLGKLMTQAQLLSRPDSDRSRTVILTVEAGDQKTHATFSLSYMIQGAQWEPQYDVRVPHASGSVELAQFASVINRTGEDWSSVRLSLSTSRPARFARVPELTPWSIEQLISQVTGQFESHDFTASVALSKVDRQRLPASKKDDKLLMAEPQGSVIESFGISALFHVPATVSIPGNGQPHRTLIASHEMKTQRQYVSIPKLDAKCYLRASLSNSLEYSLLPGMVNVFFGNDFLHKTRMELVASQGEFTLDLGTDDRLPVKRKEFAVKTSTQGLIQKTRLTEQGYEIEIQNLCKETQQVSIHDQLPVSQTKEIIIKTNTLTHKPNEFDKNTGIIKWNLTLKPGQKEVITVRYSIESPLDMQIAGL